MANTKSQIVNGNLQFFETRSGDVETILPLNGIFFEDEFFTQKKPEFTAIDVSTSGDTTPVIVADESNGAIACLLDATNEAQESGLTFGNQRPFALNRGLNIEFRAALSVVPTGNGIVVFGLAGDKNAAPNSVAESIWFRLDASAAVTVETDDTSNETSQVATGVTLTAGEYKTFRIDCTDPTNVKFYINGDRVAPSTTFNMNTVAALALQPYVHVSKASGTGVGTLKIDYIRVWQNRTA